MKFVKSILVVVLLALGAAHARAQDSVKVEVAVSAASGGSHYLDKGREEGLEEGDRVRLFPSGGATAEGTIRAVSKHSARFELDPGSVPVALGDRGEVMVPRERIAPPPTPVPRPIEPPKPSPPHPIAEPPRPVPVEQPVASPPRVEEPPAKTGVEHPPWTHPPEEWQKDQPLLAPAFGLAPEERERRVRGRAWLQSQYTRDSENGTRTFSHSSLGVDATMENPFGRGGELRFDGAAWTRAVDTGDEDDRESRLRVSRLYYTVGGIEDRPSRWSFGRFLQSGLPEFGLLDGVEWNRRLANGGEVGVSAGAMPEPFSELSSFDDVQVGAFYRHPLGDERRSSVALGYQNTWHDGEQDRNLLVGEARVQAAQDLSIRSTAWLDVYGSGDDIKGSGPELTEFLLALAWRASPTGGLGLAFSHRRIPELLRSEFQPYDVASVRDAKLDRVAVNGWKNVTPKLRLDGRVDHWKDEDDSGTSGEIGAALRDTLWDRGEVRATVLHADGTYSSGPGLRLSGSKMLGRGALGLGYEYFGYDQKDVPGDLSSLTQQALFGSLDFPLTDRWDLSLTGDRRFGDGQDAWTIGLLVQTRF